MLDRNYNIAKPAEEILAYLNANQSGCRSLRRRAVLYDVDGKWVLQVCVVEGITVQRERNEINLEDSRCYSKAILFEDWLFPDELLTFIEQILQGRFFLGKYLLEATNSSRHWANERLPLSNNYMSSAGYVWTAKFHDHVNSMHGELLAPKQPYYPDLDEAVKDWLPFPVYLGQSDSRKGEVVLLLPETRAYFEDAVPQADSIDLRIAGAEAKNLKLEVKGAWWDEVGIHHFTEVVSDGEVKLNIPDAAKRLDYILVDTTGNVYDYQREDVHRHTGLGRKRKTEGENTVAHTVYDACQNGEGPKIEFKPFIKPDDNKLSEVIRTVVAFANAQGGKIFIGINDGCEPDGINEELKKWGKAEADEATCKRYLGEIRAKIRDQVQSDVQMKFLQTIVDKRMVAVIEVSESKEKPVTIRQDKSLYIRRGASNTKASPEDWAGIINSVRNDFLPSWMKT